VSDSACPGACNRRHRAAQDAYQAALAAYDPLDPDQSRPPPPELRPWPGEPVWCARCAARVSRELAELDDLAALLSASGDGYGQEGGQRVSGSPATAGPSPAAEDLDELAGVLAGWEDAYRGAMGWGSGARRGDLASRLTTSVAWLGTHLTRVLAHEGIGPDFGTEVGEWHRRLSRLAKAGKRTLRKPLRCPGCGLLTLMWEEGEDTVACAGCGRVLTYSEYEVLVAHAAGTPAPAAA
jgi:hypothetical protein